jgi:anti-sigma-K factor RskA
MDLQSFIQSGLLEAYVAGQCTAAERQEVERMSAQHPEIRAELAKIEQALENFALANAIAPPAGLKARIMNQLDNVPATPTSPAAPTTTLPQAGTSRVRLYQLLALAGAVAASFFFWQRMFISAELEQVKAKAAELQAQVDDCSKRRERTEPMANMLRDTDTRPITLTDGKAYHITVFNNKIRKECALDISGLPLPGTGKYFQFWAIVDGKPVSMGMVELNAIAGWQPLPYIENATAYAISEENNPQGNATPTLVIAMGQLEAGG